MTTLILDGIWGGHTRWERLRQKIESSVGPCRIWAYDNSGRASITEVAQKLVAELETVRGPFHLVGYSLGGLVVREAMRLRPGLPVRRAVLLHSPHAGSWAAAFLPLPACRDMRPGSAWLRRLNAADWTIPTLVTWCATDLMVFPGTSARWARASEVCHCLMPAHAWPVVSRRLHHRVVAFLAKETPVSSASNPSL